jgi:hypothetical protein
MTKPRPRGAGFDNYHTDIKTDCRHNQTAVKIFIECVYYHLSDAFRNQLFEPMKEAREVTQIARCIAAILLPESELDNNYERIKLLGYDWQGKTAADESLGVVSEEPGAVATG